MPKELAANARYRRRLGAQVESNPALVQSLRAMCAADPLFWLGTFGMTFDPRRSPSQIPFIPYPFQEQIIGDLVDSISNGDDLAIAKSRDMGATWLIMIVILHRWQFGELGSYLCGSRKEEYVDGDARSLMWKLDFLLDWQPKWLLPNYHRKSMHLTNLDTGSSIDGESTNANFGRGDRRTCIVLDEFAAVENGHAILRATRDVTRCRIFNSTPNGTGNAFYDLCHPPSQIRRIDLHWTIHPEKAYDLEHDEEGRPTSSWYRRECARTVSSVEIAQEIDIDFSGSSYQFFDADLVQHLKLRTQTPHQVGKLLYDPMDAKVEGFVPERGGRLAVWTELDAADQPINDRRYAIGCDIAAGTGSSNSVASVIDVRTGEKVAEYACSTDRPDQFATFAVALARWFRGTDPIGAYLVWERNGPGRIFGDRVAELGYRNIYYREKESGVVPETTNAAGWTSNTESKIALLGDYRQALANDRFLNPSEEAVSELSEYVFVSNGVEHARSQSKEDPSGAKNNHGDRVIADALAWRGALRRPWRDSLGAEPPPPGSYAWRKARRRQRDATDE